MASMPVTSSVCPSGTAGDDAYDFGGKLLRCCAVADGNGAYHRCNAPKHTQIHERNVHFPLSIVCLYRAILPSCRWLSY